MPESEEPKPVSNESMAGETSADVQRVSLVSSSPSTRSIFRVVILVLVMLATKDILLALASSLTYLLFMVALAILMAYLINPLVKAIQRPFETGRFAGTMPRPVAIALAFLILFAVVGIAIASLTPRMSEQAKTFVTNIPNYTAAI